MAFSRAFASVQSRLPGQQAPSPTQTVARYQNQQLGALSTGLGSSVEPSSVFSSPSQLLLSQKTTTLGQHPLQVIQQQNQKLLGYAQIAGQRRQSEDTARKALIAQKEAARQASMANQQRATWMRSFSGGSRPAGNYSQQSSVPRTQGKTVSRIQSVLSSFPGLRITEIGGNRANDLRNGVPRWSGSYHYDTNNPAVDIAGSTAQLDRLYRELVNQGGWRQILWRVPGHYNHVHVA